MCARARGVRDAGSVGYPTVLYVPVKRHRGEPGHTRDTRDTRAHAGTRITRTNLTTKHPNPTTHPHDRATAMATAETGKKTPGGAGTHASFVCSFVSGPSRPDTLEDTHPHAPKRRAWGHTRIGGLLFAQKQTPYVGSRFPNRGYFGAFLSNETHRGGGQLDYGIAVGSYEELGICCFYTECQNKMIRVCSV